MSGSPPGTVAVLGSFMMDLVVEAPRRPEAGETVLGTGFEVFLGGKGCNQAIAAARAGATTAIIGRVGADDFGRRFLRCLGREGIDATHVKVDKVEGTGVGAPVVDQRGENSIVVVPRANHRMTVADVRAAASVIAASRVLLLQLEVPLAAVVEAAALGRAAGTTVVLNPAPAVGGLEQLTALVDVLVPNAVEAVALGGSAGDPLASARALHARTGCAVVVTVGAGGAWVVDEQGTDLIPAHTVDCVDSVGAGDAFCGALATRLAVGDDLRAAAAYANSAAALAVTRRGAEPAMPRAAAIEELLLTASVPTV